MAHGGAREGKWRGNMWMEWVASNLALYRKTVYPALLPLTRTHRLPAADWTETPADLNGLICFAERPNLVSAHVPSRFERALPTRQTIKINVSSGSPRERFHSSTVWKLLWVCKAPENTPHKCYPAIITYNSSNHESPKRNVVSLF